MELILEEIIIFFGFDLRLRTRPERLHGVERAQLCACCFLRSLDDLTLIIPRHFLNRKIHLDGIADIIRILFDEALQGVGVCIVGLPLRKLLREVNCHRCAARILFCLLNRIAAVTRRLPTCRLRLARLFCDDGHLVRNHKRRVKTNTKLPDEILIRRTAAVLLCLCKLLHECLCAGFCDGADIFDYLCT